MCVIAIADKTRPTDEMVERMFDANKSGAGIAWREPGVVRWEKGLKIEEIKEYCATAPLPYVAHFRIPSCGGSTPDLCHPFPIEKSVDLALSGKTKGYVLFHNGHWTQWKSVTYEAARNFRVKVPTGKWSDSRAMAWSAFWYGVGSLEMIEEKCVAFGPSDIEIFCGRSEWERVNDVWVSNKSWNYTTVGRGHGYQGGVHEDWSDCGYTSLLCKHGPCRSKHLTSNDFCLEHQYLAPEATRVAKQDPGGAPAHDSFRNRPVPVEEGAVVEEGVQGGEEAVRCVPEAGKETRARALTARVEEIVDTRRWLRSLNPRRRIGFLPLTEPETFDTVDRESRLVDIRQGIVRVGPL